MPKTGSLWVCVNPQAYFADLLTRLVKGWPQEHIDELMPWDWQPKQPRSANSPRVAGHRLRLSLLSERFS